MKPNWKFKAAAAAIAAALQAGAAAAGVAPAYMIVDLASGATTYENGVREDYTNDVYKTAKMVFRLVPAGTYAVQDGTRQATIGCNCYVGIYEVTVGQFSLMLNPDAVVPATPANMMPKTGIGYNALRGTSNAADAPAAGSPIGKLSALALGEGVSWHFDLPTEAMWEVAARAMPAGDSSRATWQWFFGESDSALDNYAWHVGNAGGTVHAAGLKLPNDWGFYDMYGNAAEWCRDHWSWTDFTPNEEGNVTGTSMNRSIRGGSYDSGSADCSSGVRMNTYHTSSDGIYGFRLAMATGDGDPAGGGGDAPGDDGPKPAALLSGQVQITEWCPLEGDCWRLVFKAPESALEGSVSDMVPDRSFSLKYALQPERLSGEGGADYLSFTIDAAESQDGVLTVTLAVQDVKMSSTRLFVKIAAPRGN